MAGVDPARIAELVERFDDGTAEPARLLGALDVEASSNRHRPLTLDEARRVHAEHQAATEAAEREQRALDAADRLTEGTVDPDAARKTIYEHLSHALGVEFRGAVQHPGEPATWRIHVHHKGRDVTIDLGRSEDMLSFTRCRARFLDHRIFIPRRLAKGWDETIAWPLRAVAVERDIGGAPEDEWADRIARWIARSERTEGSTRLDAAVYDLDDTAAATEQGRGEAIDRLRLWDALAVISGAGILYGRTAGHGRCLYLNAGAFAAFLADRQWGDGGRWTAKAVAAGLDRLGFERVQLQWRVPTGSHHHDAGELRKVRAWRSPPGFDLDAEEARS